jgi:glycosyltransferase involved in cell wall biosynthesis
MKKPEVSVIMPTSNRRMLARRGIGYFLRFTGPSAELVVVDSGCRPLDPKDVQDPRISYVRMPQGTSVGAMLNEGILRSTAPVVARQDDDDWYSSDYLERCREALKVSKAGLLRNTQCFFYDIFRQNAWLGQSHGSTLFFRREVWERSNFPNLTVCEDVDFVKNAETVFGECLKLTDCEDTHIPILHRGNTVRQHPRKLDLEAIARIREILGPDLEWYETIAEMQDQGV